MQSGPSMRLFLAVLLPDAALDAVDEVARGLREQVGDDGVRWCRRDQFHFTLKFLGQVAGSCVHRVTDAAANAASSQEPFSLTLGGVGAFPNDARPGTLWLGVTAGIGPMTDLALQLETELARARFPRDKRPLKAHLTIARVKSYGGEVAAARALRATRVGEVATLTVDRLTLMRSTLRPSGSEYSVVDEFRFGA